MKKIILAAIAILAAMTVTAQTDENNNATSETEFAKFQSTEYDMLCLVAHFESVRANAYWDPIGKVWTIGIGNTVHYTGRKVKSGDRIKDKEELMLYFSHHVEKYIFTDMQKYLPLSSMSSSEIVALGSMFYNTGSGLLRKKDGSPSEFAESLCDWFSTRSEEAKEKVIAYMDTRVYSRGQKINVLVKRRVVEEKILFGEIIMDNTGEYALENSVNFAQAPLGGIYSVKMADLGNVSFLCDSLNNCRFGKNLSDTIDWAFAHPNNKSHAAKTTTRSARRRR